MGVTGMRWTFLDILYNEKICNFDRSLRNCCYDSQSNDIISTALVCRVGETRNAHKILVVIPLEKRSEIGYLNFGKIN